jgi:hypothetical protein
METYLSLFTSKEAYAPRAMPATEEEDQPPSRRPGPDYYAGIADDLLNAGLASPRGMSFLRPMDAKGVREYLCVEQNWRKQPELMFERGEWKRRRETSQYLDDLSLLRNQRLLGARSLDDVLKIQRSDQDRIRLRRAYYVARMRGDFDFSPQANPVLQWEGLRRMALAAGSVTEVQIGLMFPDVPLETLAQQVQTWKQEDRLEAIEDQIGRWPTRYVASDSEAQDAIEHGEMTALEWDASAAKRTLQREHDEAVGDAMILMGLMGQEVGLDIEEVVPEHALLKMNYRPPVPDFIMTFNDGYRSFDLACEVIGKGGGYRSSQFKRAHKESGHLAYHPPYLGGGEARFV